MALTYNDILIGYQREKNHNINNIKHLQAAISSVEKMTYNSKTKDEIISIANKLKKNYSTNPNNIIVKSLIMESPLKEKDLPSRIIKVCLFEIEKIEKLNHKIDLSVEKYKERYAQIEKQEKAKELAEKILPYRDEYIHNFESLKDGIRQWNCLFSLVDDGEIQEEDLFYYGLKLKQENNEHIINKMKKFSDFLVDRNQGSETYDLFSVLSHIGKLEHVNFFSDQFQDDDFFMWCNSKGYSDTDKNGSSRNNSNIFIEEYFNDIENGKWKKIEAADLYSLILEKYDFMNDGPVTIELEDLRWIAYQYDEGDKNKSASKLVDILFEYLDASVNFTNKLKLKKHTIG